MKKALWGFLTFLCGLTAIAGINAFFRDFSTDAQKAIPNLILGLVCIPLAVLCIKKGFKPKIKPPVRMPQQRHLYPAGTQLQSLLLHQK